MEPIYQIQLLRELLGINNYPEFDRLPDEALGIAITHRSAEIPYDLRNHLNEKYGTWHYEPYEFLGDAILELLVTHFIFFMGITSPWLATNLRQAIVRNAALHCFMRQKGSCDIILSGYEPTVKMCADVFEAIIGVMYEYLYDTMNFRALDVIRTWFMTEWPIREILSDIVHTRKFACCYNTECDLFEF